MIAHMEHELQCTLPWLVAPHYVPPRLESYRSDGALALNIYFTVAIMPYGEPKGWLPPRGDCPPHMSRPGLLLLVYMLWFPQTCELSSRSSSRLAPEQRRLAVLATAAAVQCRDVLHAPSPASLTDQEADGRRADRDG